MSRVRWSCPRGRHAGIIAPERMRKSDPRRLCADCTAERRVPVKRVAVAAERRRKARDDARSAKAAKRREEASSKQRKRLEYKGTDLYAEMLRIWSLPTARDWQKRRDLDPGARGCPLLKLRLQSGPSRRVGVFFPYPFTVSVSGWDGRSVEDVIATLLHELTHALVGKDSAGKWHGSTFFATLKSLTLEYEQLTASAVPATVFPNAPRERRAAAAGVSQRVRTNEPNNEENGT